MPQQIKKVLVVGCPRSGTTYMAQLLQSYGLDVRHEEMGEDGTSSWPMATCHKGPWGARRSNFRFQNTIHVVRDPVRVVASLPTLKKVSWKFMSNYVLICRKASPLVQAMQACIGWNKLIEAQGASIRIKVEEADQLVPAYLQARNVIPPGPPKAPLPPKDANTRKHDALTWMDIESEAPAMMVVELKALAEEYGYPTTD